ncbi:MAG: aminoacyl-tRNA hydrolase [Candidatus Dadabacteria bacterium]|nr:aminoacyl-tRNA hydrolase [Candidatus Dadabacteria bacterium]
MPRITRNIVIPDDEISLEFVRASGPGGQNVNKVSTAVQLRFDAAGSESLAPDVRERLLKIAGNRATDEGVVIIEAKRFRSQEKNRKDAVDRLAEMVRKAAVKPTPRRKTRPTVSSREKRLSQKKRRSEVKRLRRPGIPGPE